ncbi:MAG: glucokinase [Thermodesulfobacteriota bacterium]
MKTGNNKHLFLAGDIGATKTYIGLFDAGRKRPRLKVMEEFSSPEAPGLETIIMRFLHNHPARIIAACFGIAGPVINGRCKTTNLPWDVSERRLKKRFGWTRVRLVNDLIATAMGLTVLPRRDLLSLNTAKPRKGQPVGLVAPGTGLGQALLAYDRGRRIPLASEGGHADFFPHTEAQARLWHYLHRQFGHVSLEMVLSGPGLVNIYRWLRDSGRYREPRWLAEALRNADPARTITAAALEQNHPLCRAALEMFISIFGAACGNLALTAMTFGGVYLGGGITPKILPELKKKNFMEAFTNKGCFKNILERIAVRVILNDKTALLGAASAALEMR